MPHHWRPSDYLERSPQPGVWLLVERGNKLGSIEYGRVRQRVAFRAMTPAGDLVGYSWSLERACDRLWEWSVRTGKRGGLTAWPWPPIQVAEDEWVVMRNSPSLPKGCVQFFAVTAEHPAFYRAATWSPRTEDRELIGYFASLELADEAILEDAPGRIMTVPDRR